MARLRGPEYTAWRNMRKRCLSSRHPDFRYYGGRGITICDRWLRSFEGFLRDVGTRPTPKHSLDRIDNNSGYRPGNVRWATRSEQMRNTRLNRIVVYGGREMVLIEACERAGLGYDLVQGRLEDCWSEDRALNTPAEKRRSRDPADPGFLPKYICRRRSPTTPFQVAALIDGKVVHVGCAPTLEAAVAMQNQAVEKA